MYDSYEVVPEYFNRRNYYKKFVREINEDKPLSDYKELEPKRDVIKAIFAHCPDLMEYLSSNNNTSWYPFVNTTIYLVKNANYEDLKKIHFDKAYNECWLSNTTDFTYIKILFALLLPSTMAKTNLYYYLAAFDWIIDHNGLYWEQKVDTGLEKLNDILNSVCEFSKELGEKQYQWKIRMESFIIAYIYLNDIKDYSTVRNFMLNPNYYMEKMELNNCRILNNFGSYDIESIRFFFNNFCELFSAPERTIK
ncbi:MAG: hypothetical protein J6X02_01915 [Bacilli bacterium]|nr:hypothetical protein [Bacilli bacterium]